MPPWTCRSCDGFVVPIPTEPIPVILTLSFATNNPPVKNERYFDVFVVPIPIDKLPSEVYKYPSNAPLTVQEPEEKALLLIPKSIKFVVSDPVSAVAIKSEEALVAAREFLILSCVYPSTLPVKSAIAFDKPVVGRALLVIVSLYDGIVVPIPIEPLELTIKAVPSGFASSSTIKAFPEPTWVILTASDDELLETTNCWRVPTLVIPEAVVTLDASSVELRTALSLIW